MTPQTKKRAEKGQRRERGGGLGQRGGEDWVREGGRRGKLAQGRRFSALCTSKVHKAPHLSDSLDNTVDVCDDSPYNTFDSPSARWVAEANTETIPGPYRAPIGWLSCQGAQIPSI